eukprot:s3568_g1.t3
MTGKRTEIWVYTDSSGARGILQRRGVGRLRHLSCRILWMQALVETGFVKLSSIAGSMNPADIGTKRLAAPRMRSLMATLGIYNTHTGNVEGCDDPAGIYRKKGNMVGRLVAILSVLSLQQVQGCQPDNHDGDVSPSLVVISLALGFAILFLCGLFGFLQQQNVQQQHGDAVEPGAEPMFGHTSPVVNEPQVFADEAAHESAAASSSSIPDEATMQLGFTIPSSSSDMPTPEGMLRWLLARCRRRLENTGMNLDRRNLYLERIEILRGLQGALQNPLFRALVMRNMAEMAAISDDENSPNYRREDEPVLNFDPQRFGSTPSMANVPVADLSKEQQDELLCTYAALILHDDGAEINPQNMTNLIKAAGCNVEAYWPLLMSKMISNVGMETLIKLGSGAGGGGGGGGGGGAAAAGGEGGATAGATEEKKKARRFPLSRKTWSSISLAEGTSRTQSHTARWMRKKSLYADAMICDRFQRFHITWTCAGGAQQPHCIPGYCRSSSGRIECKWSKGSWKRQAAAGYYDGVRE